MIERIERFLIENWVTLGLGDGGGELRWLLLTGSVNPHGKIVCPIWDGVAPLPTLIVKFPRYPSANSRLVAEYEALVEAQRYLPPGRAMIPSPVARVEIDGLMVSIETALRGRTLRASLRERRPDPLQALARLHPMAQWLADFQRRSARPADDTDLRRFILDPLDAAAAELAITGAERDGLTRLQVMANTLAQTVPLPLVFNHNDLGAPNLLVDDAGSFAGIVDWEGGGLGLPATDLLYFLARFAYEVRGADQPDELQGFRELFLGAGGARAPLRPAVLRTWLAAYCGVVGLVPAWLPVLCGIGWIMHARNESDSPRGLRTAGLFARGEQPPITTVGGRVASRHAPFRDQLRLYLLHLDNSLPGLIPTAMSA